MAAATIRKANAGDADAIADVHVRCWKEAYPGLVPSSMLDGLSVEGRAMWWRKALTASPRPDHLTVFVAVQSDGQIVGFGSCGQQRSDELDATAFDGEFQAIYVLGAVQRQGIGKRLMIEMATCLSKSEHRGASLWVLRDNHHARQFYEAMGGKTVAAREDRRPSEIILHEVAYGWKDLSALSALRKEKHR